MAYETIAITPGVGASVVTDHIAGVGDIQVMKLDLGADGVSAPVTGKTANSDAPDSTNLGVLAAVASDATPTYTEGYQVSLSTDLAGSLRTVDARLHRAVAGLRDDLLQAIQEQESRYWALQRLWTVRQGSDPLANGQGRLANAICNTHGVPYTLGGHPNVKSVRANYTGAQTNAVLVSNSVGSGKIVVTRVMATLDKGASVNVQVIVGLAAATTPTTAGVVASHPNIDPGGGFVAGDGSGALAVGNDGDQLLVTATAPTGGSVDVVVSYFILPN